jgi:tricorn protease
LQEPREAITKHLFSKTGYLYTLARDSNKPVKLTINVIGDFPGLDLTGVEKYIESSAISPNGKRIAVAGRGDIFYSC